MNKTVYISGSITDPATGQPRDGWQKDFLEAEAKLRAMGFYVINPVDIAREVDDAFKWRFRYSGSPMNGMDEPLQPKRADYIMACLQRMQMAREADMLHAVYIVGDIYKARFSHGVGMEMHLAEILDIPIYVDCAEGKRVTWEKNLFVPVLESADITELLNPEAPVVFDETLDRPLIDYPLSVRTLSCLKAAGINTLRELVRLTEKDLSKYHNFGKKSITELSDFLKDHGLTWGMSV